MLESHVFFADSGVGGVAGWKVMFFFLLTQEWEEREDEDVVVIERILLLIRNLLHVTSDPHEEKVSHVTHTHTRYRSHDSHVTGLECSARRMM